MFSSTGKLAVSNLDTRHFSHSLTTNLHFLSKKLFNWQTTINADEFQMTLNTQSSSTFSWEHIHYGLQSIARRLHHTSILTGQSTFHAGWVVVRGASCTKVMLSHTLYTFGILTHMNGMGDLFHGIGRCLHSALRRYCRWAGPLSQTQSS